jgi:alginate O-acetyltransferase complex protein AlgI
MVFSSYLFLFYFLPVALLLYYAVPRRGQHLMLTIVSFIFYGWANPLFSFLLLFSTLVDYIAGLVIALGGPSSWSRPIRRLDSGGRRTRRQRTALIVSIGTNLTLLAFFKYFNFGVDSYNGLVDWLGLTEIGLDVTLRVALPLGISLYILQSLSYVIDVYRGDSAAIKNFVDFLCFETMYPQLVAGPIIRYSEIEDQLQHRAYTTTKFARGIAFFSLGLSKKVLLANPCGKIADLAFEAGSLGPIEAWYGVTAYAFQIYFDFSGYSDMAIGLGLMLGFVFPKNFDSPYVSQSITEFWHRWHISLSAWLRDYLYIPLGGNRKGRVRTYVNLFVVMLLGGLWHGAAWNFVIWGALHGALLAFERLRGKAALYSGFPAPVRVGVTFTIVLVTWVFFRAADLPHAVRYLGDMLALGDPQEGAGLLAGLVYQPYYLGTFLLAGAIVWSAPQTWDWTRTLTLPKAAAVLAVFVLSVAVLATQAYNPFIYFIF